MAQNFAILALDECMPSAVMGLADMLSIANKVAAREQGRHLPVFSWQIVSSDGHPVRAAHGIKINVDGAIDSLGVGETIIVPGFLLGREKFGQHLPNLLAEAQWLKEKYAAGHTICATCSGVFLLAQAGLLDGKLVAATWWLQPELKRLYPQARTSLDAILTETDRIICAAGTMSHLDLSLYLIEKYASREVTPSSGF